MPRFDQASRAVERMSKDSCTEEEEEGNQQWKGPFWLRDEDMAQESSWRTNTWQTRDANWRWNNEGVKWPEEREQWDDHWSGDERFWQTSWEMEDKWAEMVPTSPALESPQMTWRRSRKQVRKRSKGPREGLGPTGEKKVGIGRRSLKRTRVGH